MLIASSRLINVSVMSLQTGGMLAQTEYAIIDPRNLLILAYKLTGPQLVQPETYLMMSDVRELSSLGLIVDSADEFVEKDDVVKLKEVVEFNFSIIGKHVRDEKGSRLGKVIDYSIEPESFLIKQIIAKRPLIKSLTDTELIFDRSQITEVNDNEIIIKHDEREPSAVKRATKAYTNPFRGQSPQPEAISYSS